MQNLGLNKLAQDAFKNSTEKGFYENATFNISEKLMLIVSELSEAQEADRTGNYSICGSMTKAMDSEKITESKEWENAFKKNFEKHVKNTFEDELADALIRILDLCGKLKIDIDWHVFMKMEYNSLREYKHGKKY